MRRTGGDVTWSEQGRVVARAGRRPVRPSTRRRRSRRSSRCSSCTPRAPRGSRRASCTPPAGTSRRPRTRTTSSSTTSRASDVYWCTADIGWVTGHSYIVYGPLANRATAGDLRGHPEHPARGPALGDHRQVRRDDLLHGAHPDPHVHEMGRRHPRRSTTCRRCGCWAASGSRSTRKRGCGTGGTSGTSNCPIVDTWWQTETGAIMISPAARGDRVQTRVGDDPAARDQRHAWSTTRACPVGNGEGGYLVMDKPWPAMLRTIFGDDERYQGHLLVPVRRAGLLLRRRRREIRHRRRALAARPRRRRDEHLRAPHLHHRSGIRAGLPRRRRRSRRRRRRRRDDRAGHRRVRHPARHRHRLRRPTRAATPRPRRHSRSAPSPNPKRSSSSPELPKTRSGKIMRRLLRDVAENRAVGDVTTLQDQTVMNLISTGLATGKAD